MGSMIMDYYFGGLHYMPKHFFDFIVQRNILFNINKYLIGEAVFGREYAANKEI